MGEMGIVIWLIEHGISEKEAYFAATGWNGDRVQVWTPISEGTTPTKYAISWNMLWDTKEDAWKARKAIQSQIKHSFPTFESDSWASQSKQGKETFTYANSKGIVEWNQDQIVMWWGF